MQRFIRIAILVFLFIILLVGIYLCFFSSEDESSYLDTIDAIFAHEDTIFAVGRNNDNDKELTKAKFTIYNKKQEKIYEKIYNKGYTSRFYDLLVDNDEDVVIVGSYEKTKKDFENKNTTAFILKTDSDGQLIFEKMFQELSNTKFYDVLSFEDGYLAIGSASHGSNQVGILVKYHKDGTFDWVEEFTEEKNTEFSSAIVYKDKIYVVGKQEKHGVLASYTLDGKMEDFLLDKNTDSFGFSSVTVVDDSLVVATSRKVSDNFSSPTLIQYDLDLKYKNDISYNSQYSGRFLKVVTDSNDDLVVLGRADEKKGKKVVHHSFIGKYRSDLTEAEVVPYYNEGDDYFTDIAFLDDNYLISGYSYYSSQGYLSKFLTYSEALEVLEVK